MSKKRYSEATSSLLLSSTLQTSGEDPITETEQDSQGDCPPMPKVDGGDTKPAVEQSTVYGKH